MLSSCMEPKVKHWPTGKAKKTCNIYVSERLREYVTNEVWRSRRGACVCSQSVSSEASAASLVYLKMTYEAHHYTKNISNNIHTVALQRWTETELLRETMRAWKFYYAPKKLAGSNFLEERIIVATEQQVQEFNTLGNWESTGRCLAWLLLGNLPSFCFEWRNNLIFFWLCAPPSETQHGHTEIC